MTEKHNKRCKKEKKPSGKNQNTINKYLVQKQTKRTESPPRPTSNIITPESNKKHKDTTYNTPERIKKSKRKSSTEIIIEKEPDNSATESEDIDIDDKSPDRSNNKQNFIKVTGKKRGTRPSLKKKIGGLTSWTRNNV